MKIKKITRVKLESPENFYDITVDKYHNFSIGDSKIICHNTSMAKAIAKLARPFGCSDQILLGDGYFGTPVKPSPAAPRYTQIKIASKYKELIERYKDLNVFNEEGGHDWIHLDYPIGLATHVVGIAVGYKSNILPRKQEDVLAYLGGNKTKKLKPYFKGFKGKISRVDSLRSSWLIEGETEIDHVGRIFKINSISPLQGYKQFFERINLMLDRSGINYKMDNYSTDEVQISIKFRCLDTEFKKICEVLNKETKQIVTENIIFVRDGSVLEYDCIEDYIEDFIVHKEETLVKRYTKDLDYLISELAFLEAKLLFLIFMSEKKRDSKEVADFIKPFSRDIGRRLESISLIRLTKEEIIKTKEEINQCKLDIKDKKEQIKIQTEVLKKSEKFNEELNKSKNKAKMTSLMEESSDKDEYYNGIRIFNPEDSVNEEIEEESEEQIVINTENE